MEIVILLLSSVGIIMWWRGVWGLADIYLYPKNQKKSMWVGAIFGFVVTLAATILAYFYWPHFLGL